MPPPSRPSPPPPAPSGAESPGPRALWATAEARLLAVGLAMTLAATVGVAVGLVLAPDLTLKIAAVIGLNTVVGPPAGMSFGYASGLGHPVVVLSTLFSESAQVLVIYPLFVLAWRYGVDTRRLAPVLRRLRVAAESGERRMHGLGILGVFLFVFIPLWMTGPVVGAVIGFLIGLRPAVNMAVVLLATALSLVTYAAFIEQVEAWTTTLHPYALFGSIVVVALVAWLVRHALRANGRSKGGG